MIHVEEEKGELWRGDAMAEEGDAGGDRIRDTWRISDYFSSSYLWYRAEFIY